MSHMVGCSYPPLDKGKSGTMSPLGGTTIEIHQMNLEQELKTFDTHKDTLLAEKKGRYVVVKGTEICSDFASYDDALADGYKRFGNIEFLVKQVSGQESVNFFTREFA